MKQKKAEAPVRRPRPTEGHGVACHGSHQYAYWLYMRLASATHLSLASPLMVSQRSLAAL